MFKDEINFGTPFLDDAMREHFPLWDSQKCRSMENAMARGKFLALKGDDALPHFLHNWVNMQQQCVAHTICDTIVNSGIFTGSIMADLYKQFPEQAAPQSARPTVYTVGTFISAAQILLEENDTYLYVFIKDVNRLFHGMTEGSIAFISNLIVECAEQKNVPVHFTYAFPLVPRAWQGRRPFGLKNPLRVAHIVNTMLVQKNRKRQGLGLPA